MSVLSYFLSHFLSVLSYFLSVLSYFLSVLSHFLSVLSYFLSVFGFFEFRTKRTVTPPLVKYRNFYSKIISTYSQISIGTFWLRPLLLKTIHYNLSLYTSMLRCYQRVSTVKCHIHTGRSYLSIQTFASRDVLC